jgi:membrane protein DedA with SNARE-associated domain
VPEWLVDLFERYGYAVVFGGVCLENAGVPVPGETALIAGAAFTHFGRLTLSRVIATAIAAAILGDNFGFLIGRRIGRSFVARHGARVGLTPERLAQFDWFFEHYGASTVFIARFVTGLRVFGAVLAGTSGLRWPRFLFYNATGAVAWSVTFGIVGYALAYSWETLERWVKGSGVIALAIVVLVVAVRVFRMRRRRS